jgi:hypothetical protein
LQTAMAIGASSCSTPRAAPISATGARTEARRATRSCRTTTRKGLVEAIRQPGPLRATVVRRQGVRLRSRQ